LLPGDAVLLRGVHEGRVRWAFPHRLVAITDQTVALYCAPGTVGRVLAPGPDGHRVGAWSQTLSAEPWAWQWAHGLRVIPITSLHSLDHFWDQSWRFQCWYVNLQAPLSRSRLG